MEITLKLSLPEVNTILKALGQGPYEQVVGLIATLQDQCQPQITLNKGKVAAMDIKDINPE